MATRNEESMIIGIYLISLYRDVLTIDNTTWAMCPQDTDPFNRYVF